MLAWARFNALLAGPPWKVGEPMGAPLHADSVGVDALCCITGGDVWPVLARSMGTWVWELVRTQERRAGGSDAAKP